MQNNTMARNFGDHGIPRMNGGLHQQLRFESMNEERRKRET
jgi:hypothetical protein